jgi:hypothetical protein
VPALDGCHNVTPGASFFDVHGKGAYMTKDGSVLYLTYHELSENPFALGGVPPFDLHDCGVWSVDGSASTGIFHGATGSGTITATVPVRADFSAHVSADYVGSLTLVDGAKAPGRLGDVSCTGQMSGQITGNVTVATGAICDLEAAAVNGNVSVQKGGSLRMQYSIADGNVVCDGCGGANVLNSTVAGNLNVDSSASGATLYGNVVNGNLEVGESSAGTGAFTIVSNYFVGKNLLFDSNTGFATISGNAVAGSLDCSGNSPPPVSSLNTAASFKGQCTA